VLNFMIAYLARAYLAYVVLAQVGVLQIIAARRRLIGLAFADYRARPKLGYAIGGMLLLGSYIWFFTTYEAIFQPGPAGAELTFLFIVAGILSLGITFTVAEVRRWLMQRRDRMRAGSDAVWPFMEEGKETGIFAGRPASFEVASGFLFYPERGVEPYPAICLLPNWSSQSAGGSQRRHLRLFAQELLDVGFVVLLVDLGEGFLPYPEILAVVPSALSFLGKQPKVDPERLGVLGLGLSGNVALRSASTDGRVKAVAALGMLLSTGARPGLDVLREMTYLQAMRWASFRQREKLILDLAAVEHLANAQSAVPTLLMWGAMDGLVPAEDRAQLSDRALVKNSETPPPTSGGRSGPLDIRIMPEETHMTLPHNRHAARTTAQWFAERLEHVA